MSVITSFVDNTKVLPMLLDSFVTYVPGCSLATVQPCRPIALDGDSFEDTKRRGRQCNAPRLKAALFEQGLHFRKRALATLIRDQHHQIKRENRVL